MLTHTFGMSKVTCMEQSDCGDGRGCSMLEDGGKIKIGFGNFN